MSAEPEIPEDARELIDQLAWMVWYMRCECDLTKPLSKHSYDSAEILYKRADELAKKYGFRLR